MSLIPKERKSWLETLKLAAQVVSIAVGVYAAFEASRASTNSSNAQLQLTAAQKQLTEVQASVATAQENLDSLKTQISKAQDFGKAIRDSRDVLANGNSRVRSMIEMSSLYATATQVPEKLLLVEVAYLSGDEDNISAVATLLKDDQTFDDPSVAQQKIITLAQGREAALHSIAERAALNAGTSSSGGQGAEDTPLERLPGVKPADTAIATVLTPPGSQGWVFVGDSIQTNAGTGVKMLSYGAAVWPPIVPVTGGTLIATQPLNLRDSPFEAGKGLGTLRGVIEKGSSLAVREVQHIKFFSTARQSWLDAEWADVVIQSRS